MKKKKIDACMFVGVCLFCCFCLFVLFCFDLFGGWTDAKMILVRFVLKGP